MFEDLKEKLWDQLKQKEVSLVMIFDLEGRILWHRGREIFGASIYDGNGFAKSYLRRALTERDFIKQENVPVVSYGESLSQSALELLIKTLVILPIDTRFFLYLDSGTNECFSTVDLEVFRILGDLLGKMIAQLEMNQSESGGICGNSPALKKIKEMVLKYSLEEEPVLFIGETGVGKSHLAELIHRYSGRKGRFVVAEVSSINQNLFESTMFGHRKGAFTDAKTDQRGLVQEAERGTLFIDEISEIPLFVQAKLLRFIEKRSYRVVGETGERSANVRIVAASNKKLPEAIANKEFREDLFYRLQVLTIEIPPLRIRSEDIREFIEKNQQYLKGKTVTSDFWEAVLAYHWPGNMRELITVLKRAGILLDTPITRKKIEPIIFGENNSSADTLVDRKINDFWIRIEQGESFWRVIKDPYLNRDINRPQVKAFLSKALEKSNGSYKGALSFLNLDPDQYAPFMKFLYRNELQVDSFNASQE